MGGEVNHILCSCPGILCICLFACLPGELDGGLEQAIANWAKRGGAAWKSWVEGYLGCSVAIAHYARTREPPAYIEPSLPSS